VVVAVVVVVEVEAVAEVEAGAVATGQWGGARGEKRSRVSHVLCHDHDRRLAPIYKPAMCGRCGQVISRQLDRSDAS